MSKTDPALAPRLLNAPTYRAALGGDYSGVVARYPGIPTTPNFRDNLLRLAARIDGVEIPSGYAFDEKKGQFYDANADHWYSDPRVLGPIAVAATGAGAGLFGGAPGLAAGESGVIPGTGIPTVAGAGGSAALPVAPTAATTAGTIATTTAAGTSALDKLRHSLTSAEGAASLASLLPALIATAKSGNGGSGGGVDSGALNRIQGITEAQMRRADPLHQVAVQLAFQRAPIAARNGISLANVPLPQ